MKKVAIILLLLSTVVVSFAQTEDSKSSSGKSYAVHSINEVGILEGENGTSFQLQSIVDVQYRRWFTGIGAGIDYYTFRTIPVFLDVRRNLMNKNKTPFIYADAGINFPWLKKEEKASYNSEFKNGWYYDIGLGYNVSFKNSGALLISAGFSQKNFTEKRPAPVFIDILPNPYPYDYSSKLNYSLRRISIKMGWIF